MTIIVLGILGDHTLEERTGFLRLVLAKEALAKVSASVDILRVAFERGPIARIRVVEFALLEINVSKLRVVVGFIEVMDLRLEFPDSLAAVGSGQLKAPRRRG